MVKISKFIGEVIRKETRALVLSVSIKDEWKEVKFLESKFSDFKFEKVEVGEFWQLEAKESKGEFWVEAGSVIDVADIELVEKEEEDTTKLNELKKTINPNDRRQLLIMAQSCQHDAVNLVNGGELSTFENREELAKEICLMRDLLLNDLIKKYY